MNKVNEVGRKIDKLIYNFGQSYNLDMERLEEREGKCKEELYSPWTTAAYTSSKKNSGLAPELWSCVR